MQDPQQAPDPGAPGARSASGAAGGPVSVLLVGSSGGHLAQLMALEPWYARRQTHWVTFRTPDAVSRLRGQSVTWAYFPTTRNLRNLVRNLGLAIGDLRRERPELVVSTGAAVAFPYFLIARLLRIRTAYIEVYDRLDSPTLTGRLCRPLASVFVVQWPEQRDFYPGARLIGGLL